MFFRKNKKVTAAKFLQIFKDFLFIYNAFSNVYNEVSSIKKGLFIYNSC